jgi:hypothetical protein
MAWWFVIVSSSKRALRVRRRSNEIWVILQKQADVEGTFWDNRERSNPRGLIVQAKYLTR